MILKDESKSLGDVIKSIRKVYQSTFIEQNIPIDPKTIHLLPICSMNKISNQFAAFSNNKAQIRVASNNPRNPNNMATPKEMKLIEEYKISKSLNSHFELENYSMIASAPIYVEQGCLKCHGEKAQTLDFVKTSYNDGFDYKLGDLRGLLVIEVSKEDIISKLDLEFYMNITVNFLMFGLFVIAVYFLLKRVQNSEQNYSKLLESKIAEQVELIQSKDKVLFQQSKMASMGEMIGNIAHQWRQPLSVISTCASGIKLEKEINDIKDERLYESLDLIVENTQYLSKTIDDFRNFFKADKVIEDFCVNDSIFKVLKLLKSSIQNHSIQVETYLDGDLIINGYPNEFLQVLINVLNNAKDALITQPKNARFINIKTSIENKKCIVEVNDNGGGVNEIIVSKIFEPYFTTKHKSQGTGIGLYMSHQIVVEHMKGSIFAKNKEMIKDGNIYKGCSLVIVLPIKENQNSEDYII